jgi:Protein of unknown function (DUF2721)
MELTYTSPALLFPAVSLILLAYVNRFHALAILLRQLLDQYRLEPSHSLHVQIANLMRRVRLIRFMQALGILSVLFAVLCMLVLFQQGGQFGGRALFFASLVSLLSSLAVSLYETHLSVDALKVQVHDVMDDAELKRKVGLTSFEDD